MAAISTDVLIIGAGAAGLAAAGRLVAAGRRVTVLEARQWVGGRIQTIRGRGMQPIEAGPEFVHGELPEFDALLKSAAVQFSELPERHWQAQGGKLKELDFGSAWERILQRLQDYDGPDLSFAEFLDRCCGSLSANEREMAIGYVEGFNAADSRLVSAKWVRTIEVEVGAIEDAGIRLVKSGYDAVIKALAEAANGSDIRLNTSVKRIRWQPGQVIAECHGEKRESTYEARSAIITLPLGVLKARRVNAQTRNAASGVEFLPDLPDKWQALDRLASGSVVKAVLRFREPFWRDLGLEEGGFLHVPGAYFLTWWPFFASSSPGDLPHLTGWCGGPRADELSRASDDEIRDAAIQELARGLATSDKTVREALADAHLFNWQRDPLACGAYSYVMVGGADACNRLAAPVENTLFFAGEATEHAYAATVGGAIHSGRRAADELLSG